MKVRNSKAVEGFLLNRFSFFGAPLIRDFATTEYGYDPLMQVESITAKDPAQNPVMTRNYQ